jgi:hypothetical protein
MLMTVLDAPKRAAVPTDFPDSPLSQALRQPLMLGLFPPIQAGGWSASTLPRTTDWTFDYNAALVRLSFYDFKPDLTFFGERVLPLLKQAGLRR